MEEFLVFLGTALIGVAAGWFIYSVMKRHTFGNLWGAMITGLIGAYIGHFTIPKLTELIRKITSFDIIPPLIGAFFLVLILAKVSPGTHKSKM